MLKRNAILFACILMTVSAPPAFARINFDVAVGVPPPPPPVIVVPEPRPGYFWAPGYWGWEDDEHIWVNGRWMEERPGYAWTPEHWEHRGDNWHLRRGYWEHREHAEHGHDGHHGHDRG